MNDFVPQRYKINYDYLQDLEDGVQYLIICF